MTKTELLFPIEGNKVDTLLMDDEALLLLGKKVDNVESFRTAWDKKLTTASKTRVTFASIKLVRKEEADRTIRIAYRAMAGLPSEIEFSFAQEADSDVFFDALVKQHFFSREDGQAKPFKAAARYGLGFLFTLVMTFVLAGRAADIANGTASESRRGRGRLVDWLLGFLGTPGTWLLGGAIAAWLLYKAVGRYRVPPQQVQLLPPQA